MASSLGFSCAVPISISRWTKGRNQRATIRCIGWDPEGILGAPKPGHIAGLEFKRKLEKDSEAKEAFERQVREEKDRMRKLRESRVIPDTVEELVEYFLDTEAQMIEFEISRLRPRLNDEFFSHLKLELGKLKFSVSKTQDVEDRVLELETLQKALEEATEAYDKMQAELIAARQNLMRLLQSTDIKATLLDLLGENALNRSLLTLLDQNIASAYQGNQKQVAEYMEKIRGAMLKYITV
ncbi:uncharacterized protein LOC121793402 isoform X1 [Salvia splendens]|uniref:uncharacterized protein LOC121793402 isoform X1 n=1 Tax=Salvia splendens TaxID=180675 RepID=UPI001C26CCC8|nr:uncharacterized protein LOC121793402 isoform X1 [Salvia splendens]